MFGSLTNDRRDEVMQKVAAAFVNDIQEEKQLCVLKDGYKELLLNKKYISVPNVMTYFSSISGVCHTEDRTTRQTYIYKRRESDCRFSAA